MLRLKLENVLGELGICALLTKINDNNEYIYLDNSGKISDITEDLYTHVF